MATFRFELNWRPSKEGKYVVYLRETIDGRRRLVKTPVVVDHHSDFNTKTKRQKWVRGNSDEVNRKNQLLRELLENVKARYLKRENQAQNGYGEYSRDMMPALVAESEPPYCYGPQPVLNEEEQDVLEKLKSMDRRRVEEIIKIYRSL